MCKLTTYLLSITLLIAISIFALRIYVRRDYLNKGNLSAGSAVLQAFIFFTFGGFPIFYLPVDWPVSHVIPILRVAGLTCMVLGLAVLFVAMFRLGVPRSFGLQIGELKRTDFYRVTRNPQVLGCFLYVVGFTFLWPSWYALGWCLSLFAIIHLMVITEEEYLSNSFNQDYELYCKSVPRYLGYPKKPE